ncbi:MAG: hypothetical protein JNL39_09530 [Opitutaceae bacterium]|nr:hypothetical protein [Opitutaceae bacterium]
MNAVAAPRPWRLLLLAAIAAYATVVIAFPGWLRLLGVNHLGHWFLDAYAILASNDALRAGLDPWGTNPLDPLGRPHVYSHWWLQLEAIGLTRAHTVACGVAVGVLFLAAALARLRPRSVGEWAWFVAVLCAPPVVMGVERANNDLVIFVLLAPVVPCLLSQRPGVRWVAVVLVALASGLKFYPAVAALVLLAGADGAELRRRLVFGGLLLAVVAANVVPDLALIGSRMPRAEGPMTLGASHLLGAGGLRGFAAKAAGFAAVAAVAIAFLRPKACAGWTPAPELRGAWWGFVLGAVLLTGCFFTGTSYGYRWVFAVWLAPLLWELPRDAAAPACMRRLARLTAWLLGFALWGDGLFSLASAWFAPGAPIAVAEARGDRFFVLSQPLVWALFACLLVFLAHFAREAWRTLTGPVPPRSAG